MIVGFSKAKNILSRLIRWVTKSEVSHTFLRLKIKGQDMVLHSNQWGVNFDQYEDFVKHSDIVAQFELTMEQEDAAWDYALTKLDRPYDFLAIAGFAWVLLNKRFGRKTKNPFPNKSAYFCSELVIEALKAAEFPGSADLDRELTSPEDLINFLNIHEDTKLL